MRGVRNVFQTHISTRTHSSRLHKYQNFVVTPFISMYMQKCLGLCLLNTWISFLDEFCGCFFSGHAHLTDFNIATIIKDGERATALAGTKPYMGDLHCSPLLDHIWCYHFWVLCANNSTKKSTKKKGFIQSVGHLSNAMFKILFRIE